MKIGLHFASEEAVCKLLQLSLSSKVHPRSGQTGLLEPHTRGREASTFAHAAEFSKTGAVDGVKKPPTRAGGLRDWLGTGVVSESRPKALLVELQGP